MEFGNALIIIQIEFKRKCHRRFWRLDFRRYSAWNTAIIDLPYISIAICGVGSVSSAVGLLGDSIYGLGLGFRSSFDDYRSDDCNRSVGTRGHEEAGIQSLAENA
jgi:hypothetical protein